MKRPAAIRLYYNIKLAGGGNDYSQIGGNFLDGASPHESGAPDYGCVNMYGYAILIDVSDIKPGQTYTLTLDHEYLGKISVEFQLEEIK